jgi:biotin carboxyl carrier protein
VLQGEQRVAVTLLDMGPPVLLTIDGKPYEVTVDDFGEYNVVGSGHHFRVGTLGTATRVAAAIADGVYAPMPGRIVKVLCRVGDVVERGAAVVVLEAMKMENELAAPARGRVTEVLTTEGNAVEARTKLVTLAEA